MDTHGWVGKVHGDRPKGVVKTNSLTANTIVVSMDREARVRALLKECSNLEQVLAREVSCAPAGEAVLPAGSSEECCNCTLGLLLHDNAIRSIMEGGPAFSSQLLDQGDVILEVDGHDATPGRLPELLIGCDVPGSFVTITVQNQVVKADRRWNQGLADPEYLMPDGKSEPETVE
ncbi:MAG: hypothetical protein ACPIOQ_50100, partial [Promethearchaeia archaeon]